MDELMLDDMQKKVHSGADEIKCDSGSYGLWQCH